MNNDILSAGISALLGGGLVAMLTAGVKAWQDVRKGRLSNSGTVLDRLDAENRRLVADGDKLRAALAAEEAAHDKSRRALYAERERAERYRVQLIAAGLTPIEAKPREDHHEQ